MKKIRSKVTRTFTKNKRGELVEHVTLETPEFDLKLEEDERGKEHNWREPAKDPWPKGRR